ncbi:hypothetical protein DSL64_21370 [Dyadobacter luteus]|uniref:DUF1648 domain-containing protein n=1 Tax=Dyadobacter luteus TaxID=2259619 RepID=A0A3D8Y5Y2_9BACT|nr:hypothetical protein DSL64_21370 [Dyadobacter luteus]
MKTLLKILYNYYSKGGQEDMPWVRTKLVFLVLLVLVTIFPILSIPESRIRDHKIKNKYLVKNGISILVCLVSVVFFISSYLLLKSAGEI